DGKDKYAYVGNGQTTICVLVFEGDEAPDIITIGKKGEHGNFEERWERRRGQPAQLVITCPQAHLHSEPQLMPGPWCDVCSGKGQIEIVVGSTYEYRELCPVDEC